MYSKRAVLIPLAALIGLVCSQCDSESTDRVSGAQDSGTGSLSVEDNEAADAGQRLEAALDANTNPPSTEGGGDAEHIEDREIDNASDSQFKEDAQVGADAAPDADSALHHYVDPSGAALVEYDAVWEGLHDFFGASTPDRITVEDSSTDYSTFNPYDDSIQLSAFHKGSVEVLAHESTHLCLSHLTHDASTEDRFRFFDEGFANILGKRIATGGDDYKQVALIVAASQNEKANVSFSKVQDWSHYWGTPQTGTTPYAYDVGASFDYMIEDTYGKSALFEFFTDVGDTRNLGATLTNLFSSTQDQFEARWKDYLSKVVVDHTVPEITSFNPNQHAANVPLDIGEVVVQFSMPMSPSVCLVSSGNEIPYQNAYWKSATTLAVKTSGTLKPNYQYVIELGSEHYNCRFMSAALTDLPVTKWSFTTGN